MPAKKDNRFCLLRMQKCRTHKNSESCIFIYLLELTVNSNHGDCPSAPTLLRRNSYFVRVSSLRSDSRFAFANRDLSVPKSLSYSPGASAVLTYSYFNVLYLSCTSTYGFTVNNIVWCSKCLFICNHL